MASTILCTLSKTKKTITHHLDDDDVLAWWCEWLVEREHDVLQGGWEGHVGEILSDRFTRN